MTIKVEVWGGGHPVAVTFTRDHGDKLRIDHRELLQWEHAIALAKQMALNELSRKYWHEVDAKFAAT